eukprot:TRINITY_DN20977_c0_g1_i1.p2 TRINITY_DN20977_c0_g1~~TRINITY_DN20977_c0_g1_i1.p2  ORF type:complete len:319 (+),score=113.32 TRINITY_DN20977_c0_g1_i1:128-958(+)
MAGATRRASTRAEEDANRMRAIFGCPRDWSEEDAEAEAKWISESTNEARAMMAFEKIHGGKFEVTFRTGRQRNRFVAEVSKQSKQKNTQSWAQEFKSTLVRQKWSTWKALMELASWLAWEGKFKGEKQLEVRHNSGVKAIFVTKGCTGIEEGEWVIKMEEEFDQVSIILTKHLEASANEVFHWLIQQIQNQRGHQWVEGDGVNWPVNIMVWKEEHEALQKKKSDWEKKKEEKGKAKGKGKDKDEDAEEKDKGDEKKKEKGKGKDKGKGKSKGGKKG